MEEEEQAGEEEAKTTRARTTKIETIMHQWKKKRNVQRKTKIKLS